MSVIIRLQNLPWSASSADIRRFFKGLTIPDGGVHIVGGDEGDAFIAFATDEDARQAMRLTGEPLNGIPVKLFLSSRSEMQSVINIVRGASQGQPAPQQQTATTPPIPNLSQLHIPANLQGINFNQLAQSSAPSQPPAPAQSQASAMPALQQLGLNVQNQPSNQQLHQIAQLLSTPQAVQLQNQLGLNLAGLLGQAIPSSQNQQTPAVSQPVTAPFNSPSSTFPTAAQDKDGNKTSSQSTGSSRWGPPLETPDRGALDVNRPVDRHEPIQGQRMRDDNRFGFRDDRPPYNDDRTDRFGNSDREPNRFERGTMLDRGPTDQRQSVQDGVGGSDFSGPDFGRGRAERLNQLKRDGFDSDRNPPVPTQRRGMLGDGPERRGMLGDGPGDRQGLRIERQGILPSQDNRQDGRLDRPPFQDGRPDRPLFQDGRPDRTQFPDARPDRPPFQDGRPDRPPFQDGRSDRLPFPDGRSNRPPFPDSGPDRPPFPDSRQDRPQFQDGRQDRPPFRDGRLDRPFQDSRPDGPFRDRPPFPGDRLEAPPFQDAPPDRLPFRDVRPGERPPFNDREKGPSGIGNRFGQDDMAPQRGWNEGMPPEDRTMNRFQTLFDKPDKSEPPVVTPGVPSPMNQAVSEPVWGRNIPSNKPQSEDPFAASGRCMLLTNLPNDISFRDVRRFFNLEVPRHGLKFAQNEKGERIGTAYVRFATAADCRQALKDNKIASRDPKIVFKPCSEQEFELAVESSDDANPAAPERPPDNRERPEKRGRSNERDRERRDRRERDDRRRSRSRSPKRSSRDRRDRDRRDDRNRSDRDRRRRDDEKRDSKSRSEEPKELCLSVKNLPPKLKIQDILEFFSGLKLIKNSVYIEYDAKGTAVGPAYMEFSDKEDFKAALSYDKKLLISRFVDVEAMTRKEIETRVKEHKRSLTGKGNKGENKEGNDGKGMEAMDIDETPGDQSSILVEGEGPPPIDGPFLDNSGSELRSPDGGRGPPEFGPRGAQLMPVPEGPGDFINLRLSINGLPMGVTIDEIVNWFEGVRIVPGSVMIDPNRRARAFLTVETHDDLVKALAKHRQYMGKRFISVWHWKEKGAGPEVVDDAVRGERPPRFDPNGPIAPRIGGGPPNNRFDGEPQPVNRFEPDSQGGVIDLDGPPQGRTDRPPPNFFEGPGGPPDQFIPGGPLKRFEGPPMRYEERERERSNRFELAFRDRAPRFDREDTDRDRPRMDDRDRRPRLDDDRRDRDGRRSRFDDEPRDRPSRFDDHPDSRDRRSPPRFRPEIASGDFDRDGPPREGFDWEGDRFRDGPPGSRMDFKGPPSRGPMDFPGSGPMDGPRGLMNFNGPPNRFGPRGGRGPDFGRDRARFTGHPNYFHPQGPGALPGFRGPPPARLPMGVPDQPGKHIPAPAFMPGEAPPPNTFIGEMNDIPESFYSSGFSVVKVSRLPYKTRGPELEKFFSEFNPVEGTGLMRVTPDGKYTGEGVVAFKVAEDADKALNERDGKIFGKKPIRCTIVLQEEQSGPAEVTGE